jgi:hypothetical protein
MWYEHSKVKGLLIRFLSVPLHRSLSQAQSFGVDRDSTGAIWLTTLGEHSESMAALVIVSLAK